MPCRDRIRLFPFPIHTTKSHITKRCKYLQRDHQEKSMATSSIPPNFDSIRNPKLRNNNSHLRKSPLFLHLSSRSTFIMIPSANFNFFEMMGGRGICNGEKGLAKELETKPESLPQTYSTDPVTDPLILSLSDIGGENSFDKELMGLTGGFPGGEKGIQRFLEKNPSPIKNNGGVDEVLGFLPGMTVIVKNRENPFYMYCGIVKSISDGKVGVIFEGGNWDEIFSFKIHELERREEESPMVNSESAIHESHVDRNSE
uniref:NdhS n=1 Tax=Erycina pusilla TaxID=154679 RepID=A0A0F6PKD7_9ASPA|nr:NdhS [Erycina pusilla]